MNLLIVVRHDPEALVFFEGLVLLLQQTCKFLLFGHQGVVLKGDFAHYDVHLEDCVFNLVDALTEHGVLNRDRKGRVVGVVSSGQKFEIILKILFFFNKQTFLVKKLFAFLHSKMTSFNIRYSVEFC